MTKFKKKKQRTKDP